VGLVGGSAVGVPVRYLDFAEELGESLGLAGFGLVYGGSAVGVVGAAVHAAIRVGAHVVGIVPHGSLRTGAPLASGSELHVVRTAVEGDRLMRRLAGGFVVLPGGLATVAQVGALAAGPFGPVVLVNQDGYFDPLLAMLDHAVAEAFVTHDERRVIEIADTVDGVLHHLGLPTLVVRS
jgi:hypothetical protein